MHAARMFLIGICASVSCAFAFQAEPPAGTGDSGTEPTGRVIVLDHDITDVDEFVLDEGDTLVVHENRTIRVNKQIVLRGQVRVELPEDAPQGAWAPQLNLGAGECIVITGLMTFGDGRDGIDPFVMGGAGASLTLHAPILAIGVQEIRMGDGGRGGPGAEGGLGGGISFPGWVLPFHPDGLVFAGGDGGDGGDGPIGTRLHPRGFRGGDGGDAGDMNQAGPIGCFDPAELKENVEASLATEPDYGRAVLSAANRLVLKYMQTAIGIDPNLDPFLIGVHRRLPHPVEVHAGDGGDGGNGGPHFEGQPYAGGGRAGNGGMGGHASSAWGLPGTNVTPQDDPPAGVKWTGGRGSRGGDGFGGDGGHGGNAGPRPGLNSRSNEGGRGGDGGGGFGGRGGSPGHVDPPPRYSFVTGQAGLGGRGVGGRGGNGGNGHSGGDGGDAGSSQNGATGDEPLNVPPRQQNSAGEDSGSSSEDRNTNKNSEVGG